MMGTFMLLIAAMLSMSSANRLKLKSEYGVVPPVPMMLPPMPMMYIPVVGRPAVKAAQTLIIPFLSNTSVIGFPTPGWIVDISDNERLYGKAGIDQPSIMPQFWSNASDTRVPVQMFPEADVEIDGMSTPQLMSFQMQTMSSPLRKFVDSLMTPSFPNTANTDRAVLSTGIDCVKSLELNSFLGRWYQMYGSSSSKMVSFGNAGLISDYEMNADGSTINVLNQVMAPDGQPTGIWGKAKATDLAGQLKISFNTLEGDYWIYKLGPVRDSKYDYAIVGVPVIATKGMDQTQLLVLARDPKEFLDKYDGEVLEWLAQNFPKFKTSASYLASG